MDGRMDAPRPAPLHADANARTLLFFRLWVFGLWFVAVAVSPLERLAALPPSYYEPVGVLRLLPAEATAWLLSAPGLGTLKAALLVALGLSLVPRLFRYAAPPAVLLLVVHQALVRGFGHVNHAEIVPLLAALTLALFALLPARERPGHNPYATPLVTVALVAAVCYSLVGLYRLWVGVGIFTGDSILNFVVSRSLRTSYYDFNLGRAVVEGAPAAFALRAGFPVVTLVEVLAPLVLVSRAFRWVFLGVMVPFHLLTLTLMEVSFVENLLLYVFFVDVTVLWPRWFSRSESSTLGASVSGSNV